MERTAARRGVTEKILVVDNEEELRFSVEELLEAHGFHVVTAEDGDVGLERIRTEHPSVILLDLGMPRLGGMEVLAKLKEEHSSIPVVILTADDEISKVVDAMRLGAYDYLTKPFRNDDLVLRVRHALERRALLEEVDALRSEIATGNLAQQMGTSQAIQKLAQQVKLVAASNFSVLVEGETGTGKEIVARAIHAQSSSRRGRFVAVDCGAIPETLIESELFGHEKGAFTGADRRKDGYFQRAEGGTLFLDEIVNLPTVVQGKLLRTLQEREVHPLGSTRPTPIDVRIIAACNVPLDGEVRSGRFRHDLYYRLNEFALRLVPLRERREDIAHLARRFLDEVSMELRRPVCDIEEDAMRLLLDCAWPGNARELKNVIRRAALVGANVITAEEFRTVAPEAFSGARRSPRPTGRAERSLREIAEAASAQAEQEAIREALEATRGNKTEAARLLRIDYKTLYLKIKRYGITTGEIPRPDGEGAMA